MTGFAKKVLEDALRLSEEERTELISALSDSLEHDAVDLGDAWSSEVRGRIAEVETGEVETIPWSEVDARIRRVLDGE
jgi:putative addiction module component (TIGR02574 family)